MGSSAYDAAQEFVEFQKRFAALTKETSDVGDLARAFLRLNEVVSAQAAKIQALEQEVRALKSRGR